MYYPYLRGRQFELIALREFAVESGTHKNIIPIIEPVKKTFNSIKLALPKLIENNMQFALIMNPNDGDFKGSKDGVNVIIKELQQILPPSDQWIPTFIVQNDYEGIAALIEEKNFKNVMVFCSENTDFNNSSFGNLISSDRIQYILSKDTKSLIRKLKGKGKQLIRLDDNFNKQLRNSDYLSMPDEKFTDEHQFYRQDGFDGFSDFTVLTSEFTEGGAAPFAVAIHLTYENENNEIWIKHFTSDTNDDRSNIQGKFEEAAAKAVEFLDAKKIHTLASKELRRYYDDAVYPGLGMIKKISIKNHLELINSIIR